MKVIIPDSTWYKEKSRIINSFAQCPYADVRKCQRYFASIDLLTKTGIIAGVNDADTSKLRDFWAQSNISPLIEEEKTAIIGFNNESSQFINFCPEVSFQYLQYYASYLSKYADEIDHESGVRRADNEKQKNDWRYKWSEIIPCHYSECDFYKNVQEFHTTQKSRNEVTKSLIAGATDYSHQSFSAILADLRDEKRRASEFRDAILKNINFLKDNAYWNECVPSSFQDIVEYSVKFFGTSIVEIGEVADGLNHRVEEHHIARLRRVSEVAHEINRSIGKIWHQSYSNKEYGNSNFHFVEKIYADTRDMAVNLLDTQNIAERLCDFMGKSNAKQIVNNPWISGSFYLVSAMIVIIGLAVLSNSVPWFLFPIIVISGILMIVVIGILQLRNDNKISDKSFVSLISETFKSLPLLRKTRVNESDADSPNM